MDAEQIVLEFRGQFVEVRREISIGRSPACEIAIFNDAMVSRMHARLVTNESGTTLMDMNSSNGVYLNGVRLTDPKRVKPGDIIRIGDQSLAVMSQAGAKRSCSATSRDLPAAQMFRPREEPADADLTTKPYGIDRYHVLWLQIEDAITRQDWTHAEQLLQKQLDRVAANLDTTGELPQASQEQACRHAIDMALASKDARWIEALIDLHMAARRPLPSAAAANLAQILTRVRGFDLSLLHSYVEVLREQQSHFSPIERQLCSSIEVALMLAAAKQS
jgi:pSer/pThr/pTyr-binding forkhead associated (FHA) protein